MSITIFPRSFSYGALPGVEEFQKRHNPLYTEDEDDYLVVGGRMGDSERVDGEDCDSGILVNGSITSSLCGGRGASFRTDSSTPSSFHAHARSASQDQTPPHRGMWARHCGESVKLMDLFLLCSSNTHEIESLFKKRKLMVKLILYFNLFDH